MFLARPRTTAPASTCQFQTGTMIALQVGLQKPWKRFRPTQSSKRSMPRFGKSTCTVVTQRRQVQLSTPPETIQAHGGIAFKWSANQPGISLAASSFTKMVRATRATTHSIQLQVSTIGLHRSCPKLAQMETSGYSTGTTTSSSTTQLRTDSRPVRVLPTRAIFATSVLRASIVCCIKRARVTKLLHTHAICPKQVPANS